MPSGATHLILRAIAHHSFVIAWTGAAWQRALTSADTSTARRAR